MKIFEMREAFLQASDSLKSNRMRSFLASLGVIIGISFVLLMGWVLSGLDKAMSDSFKMMGVDVMYVDKHDWAGGKSWKDVRNRPNISLRQADKLIESLTDVELAVPVARRWQTEIKFAGNTYNGITSQGTYHQFGFTPGGTIEEGRFFTQNEDQFNSSVVCLGYKVAETIFPKGDAVGKEIKIEGSKFLVVGVIKKQGTTFFDFLDNIVYMPLSTFMKTFGRFRRSFSIAVKAGSVENLDNARAEVEGKMRIVRNLDPGEENDFSINETKAFEAQLATIRTVVWSVGIGMTLLSFIVGIIGIVNVMFVSIFERTREIGIRKALGAKKRIILMQIVFEAMILSFLGAVLSFIFSSLVAYITGTIVIEYVPQVSFLSPYMPLDLLLISSVISIIVGIVSGLIPAIRASNFEPVIALRYE
jgi:putative ABC transport system permease protein